MAKSDRAAPKSVTADGAESAGAGAGCNVPEGQMCSTIYRETGFEGDILEMGVSFDGDIWIHVETPDGAWAGVELRPDQARELAEALMEATDD